MERGNHTPNKTRRRFSLSISVILVLSMLLGCSPSADDIEAVDYTPSAGQFEEADYAPLPGDDWQVSTPAEQGLDPRLVAELYEDAADLETLYGVLVVKNGYLIAEDYFNGGSREGKTLLQSASKSYLSALIGIALDEGCLSSVEQKMTGFFPEFADRITDPRKKQITIREMLQMRAGYPDEETDSALLDALYWGVYPPLIVEFPLVSDPGTRFNYSNLTYNWLAILLARACGTDLKSYAQEHLFAPTGTEVGEWLQDRDGHYIGSGGIHVTARDAAKFGLLYLNGGKYGGSKSSRPIGSVSRSRRIQRVPATMGGAFLSATWDMAMGGGRRGQASTISTLPGAMADS